MPGPEVHTQNLIKENLPSSGNPVADQIISQYEQIRDLVYPFFVVNQPLPQNVQNQVNGLLAQANALAGGDAAQYLNDFLLQLENAAAPLEAQIGEGYGYVAPYSILFFAEIKRPAGILRLRGKTQPFGQYLIFVPSDGVLQYISFYDPKTKYYGIVYPRVRPNWPYRQPRLTLMPTDASFSDSDNDGLPDVVEMVYRTDPANPDTDGDGIKDGAAVDLGLDPLGGKQTRTGIIATASTPGTAVDIAVENGLAVVAQLDKGMGIFDISNPLNPTLVGQIATPGNARAVARYPATGWLLQPIPPAW